MEIYRLFDIDGDLGISSKEIKHTLQSINVPISNEFAEIVC